MVKRQPPHRGRRRWWVVGQVFMEFAVRFFQRWPPPAKQCPQPSIHQCPEQEQHDQRYHRDNDPPPAAVEESAHLRRQSIGQRGDLLSQSVHFRSCSNDKNPPCPGGPAPSYSTRGLLL